MLINVRRMSLPHVLRMNVLRLVRRMSQMPGVRGEKVPRVVLRLLQEYESARFSLHNHRRIVDNRECFLVRGEDLIISRAQEGDRYVPGPGRRNLLLLFDRFAYCLSCSALYWCCACGRTTRAILYWRPFIRQIRYGTCPFQPSPYVTIIRFTVHMLTSLPTICKILIHWIGARRVCRLPRELCSTK